MRGSKVAALLVALTIPTPSVALDTDALHLRGLLDLTAAGGDAALSLNAMNQGDSNFDPYRLRLFLEAQFEGGLEAHVQAIVIGQNYALLQYGAYALWTPYREHDLHMEAGLIPWPIGTWAPRAYSSRNVLIGTPMLYQLHGTLSFAELPPNTDALFAAAGTGERGVDYGNGALARGVPTVYDRCWDAGAVAIGSLRPIEFAAGFVQGAPSWPQNARDASPGKTILGRFGITPIAALRFGLSGAQGPWLPRSFETALPPGARLADLVQRLAIADFEVQGRHLELRGEGYVNEWQTPFVGRLVTRGMWAEVKVGVGPGVWLAARGETRRHSRLTSSIGVRQPWDHNRERWEGGIGYRATRQAVLKAVWQSNVERIPNTAARTADLMAATLSLSF